MSSLRRSLMMASKKSGEVATFGGLEIAPAPLHHNGTSFEIIDNDWNHESYGTAWGQNAGSYYFNWANLAWEFNSANGSSGSTIDNLLRPVTYNGYNDWRVIKGYEAQMLVNGNDQYRPGATINDSKIWWAWVDNTNLYNNFGRYASQPGWILFPDDKIIITDVTITNGAHIAPTDSQLQNLIDQGCRFIPLAGHYYLYGSAWYSIGVDTWLWCAEKSGSDAQAIKVNIQYSPNVTTTSDFTMFTQQYLVRTPITVEPTFDNGIAFASGPLIYQNDQFRIQDYWHEYNSCAALNGLTNRSTFFNWDIVHDLTVNKNNKTYRLPTKAEFEYLYGNRRGSIYNGTSGVKYALISTTFTYGGSTRCTGILFFPDGFDITGPTLSSINSVSSFTSLQIGHLNNLIKKGVLFIPCGGTMSFNSWTSNSSVPQKGMYWSSESDSSGYGYYLNMSTSWSSGTLNVDSHRPNANEHMVLMVRDV